jgi:hypothetical protein
MSIAIVPVTVPPFGDGPIADISALVGAKTVTLTGFFQGAYTLLASHDNNVFVPVLLFNSDGRESIKLTLPDAYLSVRVRASVNVSPSVPVTVTVAGVSKPGENLFATLATFASGNGGTSGVIDTAGLFPPTGLESEINFICNGGLNGTVLVEGSNDGSMFNVIGTFQAGERQRPLLGLPQPLEFEPLSTGDNSRYLRFTVDGQVSSTLVLTVGGRIPSGAPTPGATESVVLDEDEGRAAIITHGISTEVILYEWFASFVSLSALVTAKLDGIAKVSPIGQEASGVFKVYVGATSPGDTTGGTLVLTSVPFASDTDTTFSVTGPAFANPGENVLVQITGEAFATGEAPSCEAHIRGIVLAFN